MELTHIGRYDIKSLIGQGGMSAVYLGYDPRSQREVAVKILPPYYLHSPKFRERFEREALMIALLEHPAIVPVYDMGEENGQPYIVMRYMSGGSLADKLQNGPIPLQECIDMYLRLAPALDTAHARGVTHRDVKPDNLLFDKYNNVFLSDFGLARLRETIGFANISDGSIMGTPAYMSPEQIQGDRQIDGRSDIYSMGVVLYQMLCGYVPFSGSTAASVMMMHLINPVPQIVEKNKNLPAAIQAVLDTAMAKNPDDRYQTAAEFARVLQAVGNGVRKRLSGQPTSASATGTSKKPSGTGIPSKPEAPGSLAERKRAHRAKSGDNKTPVPGSLASINNHKNNVIKVPSSPGERLLNRSTSRPDPLQKPRFSIPLWGWIASGLLLLFVSLIAVLAWQGLLPAFALYSPPQSSPSAQLTSSETASNQVPVTLGQADMLAFVRFSEIWISDLHGGNLTQLTADGQPKSHLQWSPDGQSVLYTSANCINQVELHSKQPTDLTCFSGVTSVSAFDISPDGLNAALGLDQTNLYLLPYSQLFSLRKESLPEDILALTQCSYFAPFHTDKLIKAANWSQVEGRLAMLFSSLVDGIYRDEVTVLDFSHCSPSPAQLDQILPAFLLLTMPGYFDHSELSGISWNGDDRLLLNGYLNTAGFGDLQVYNLSRNESREINPNGSCCYRDAHWSPDGTYLFYTYQPETGGEISLFYTQFSNVDQPGAQLTSLTLPAGFITADQQSLQPALRPAH